MIEIYSLCENYLIRPRIANQNQLVCICYELNNVGNRAIFHTQHSPEQSQLPYWQNSKIPIIDARVKQPI